MMILVHSEKDAAELCQVGDALGLRMYPLQHDVETSAESAIAIGAPKTIHDSKHDNNRDNDYGSKHNNNHDNKKRHLIFYFNQIPLDKIDSCICDLIKAWRDS